MIIITIVVVFIAAALLTDSRWEGDATEAAAAPLAARTGAEEASVLPWKIEGDLLLFFFLAGGAAAGFAAGYYWRGIFGGGSRGNVKHGEETPDAGGDA